MEYLTHDGYPITVGEQFVYEVSIYKIYKKRVECIGLKKYYFDKPIKIKKHSVYIKRKDYTLCKFLDWLKAPIDYIIKQNFKILEPYVRKRKNSTRKRS